MERPSLLKVDDLRIGFADGTQAVKGLSFSLQPGEILGMVGESGSGKTLTAWSIMRLTDHLPGCRVSGGSMLFQRAGGDTVDLRLFPASEMNQIRGREIAMIFQEPMSALNPVFTCGNQLMEGLQIHLGMSRQAARKRALDLLDQVQLEARERIFHAYPHQLSGGQQQRVMIAMAIACGPRLLLADEPTTALDRSVEEKIVELLRSLKKDLDFSMIFVSHDLNLVGRLADRVLVMREGEKVEEGKVEEVFHHPAAPYTKMLLSCRPPREERWRRLPTLAEIEKGWSPEPMPDRDLSAREIILDIQQISVRYPGRNNTWIEAVKDFSLTLRQGEVVGIVGPSGSGKSTVGKAVMRMAPLSAGKIVFEGRDISAWKGNAWREVQRKIQMIFQNPFSSLNPRLPVGWAIEEPLRVHEKETTPARRRERVMELLDSVGLEASYFTRYPHELSGGQRQRICIARALALNPRLLICDECVSALDVSVQAQILNLLADLRDRLGISMLFISHDPDVVRFMSDTPPVMAKKIPSPGKTQGGDIPPFGGESD